MLISQPPLKFLGLLLILIASCLSLNRPISCRAADTSPFTITDAAGVFHIFKAPPKRFVVVGNAPFMPLHLLYLFPEAKDVLVGYERKFKSAEAFLPLIDPRLDKKTVLSANPGSEQIAALHPDVVITKGSTIGPLDNVLDTLGIPLVHLGIESPKRFLKDVALVGALLDNRARANTIIDFYTQRLDFIRSGLESIPFEKRSDVLLMEYSNRGGETIVRVPGKSWIQTVQTETAGGRPVWTTELGIQHGWQVVGFEQIASWNPDKIFIIVSFRLDGMKVLQALKQDAHWRMLKAAAGDELYLFPVDIFGWDSADPRWILGTMWLATKIYPRHFAAIDMQQQVMQFFETMYAMDPSTIQSELLPRINTNGK